MWRFFAVILVATVCTGGPALAQRAKKAPPGGEGLTFSSFCVVFTTENSEPENVRAALKTLFAGKTIELKGTSGERSALLRGELQRSLKLISDQKKLENLLVQLTTK